MTRAAPERLWYPYAQHAVMDPPVFVRSAEGAHLHARDGRRIFDAVSSWWVNLHGHAHPAIARAVAKQARTLEHVLFAGFTHEPAQRLARGLCRIAPRGLERVFLSDNGSTAVEVALKMAAGYWKNRGEDRRLFVALEHAYHGDTFGAMAVSARGPFTAAYEPLLFDVRRLPFPEPGREQAALDAFEGVLRSEGRRVAGLIVEPLVLGAGGMRMYSPEALKALREICARGGIPFSADEVMPGFGRTGPLFASEAAGISPDLLCLSKGLTGGFMALGATLATEEIFRSFLSRDRGRAFFHGHSYTANPLACAAAVASLRVFETEPVARRIERLSGLHRRELRRFAGNPRVAAVRQRGTIAALELRAGDPGYLSALAPKLQRFYLSRDVLLRPLGNVVYLLPPYCSQDRDIVSAYDAIEESITLLG
ncbi:MAG: adenosylmethionine--8-amino-7-oxononanoate transaminase [Elusimicrobia bacterium]|nr:adenosylmethionine--8-amino-7-oxononanoate transaminase [Elusimicrobiota bacterium]